MSAMARRSAQAWIVAVACLLAPVAALGLLCPVGARADGDPASDVLLGENVFYPYTPPVTASLQRSLNARAAAAHRAGFPVKVALIASPTDLGVITSLFGKPQTYANFLDREISFQGPQPLLVVMAAGYGVQGTTPAVARAVTGLPKPAGRASNQLAQAAITALSRMASASGHRISAGAVAPDAGSSGSSNSAGSSTVIVGALAVAAVLVASTLIALRRRAVRARRAARTHRRRVPAPPRLANPTAGGRPAAPAAQTRRRARSRPDPRRAASRPSGERPGAASRPAPARWWRRPRRSGS